MMDVLRATLAHARRHDYTGWDLYDGESSRILRAIPVSNRWLNLAFQQAVKRFPVNIRPLLLVEQRRNFKGAALFALANFDAHELTGDQRYQDEARDLVEWLVADRIDGYSGFCGGHNHPVQHLKHRATPETPGVVGTSYAVKALLRADAQLGERRAGDGYGEIARSATGFVFEDLDYTETERGATIRYRPDDPGGHVTLNANALGARLLLDLHEYGGWEQLRRRAERILDYVAGTQTELGGWPYRDPPSASHLSMDNYHNGFIIESFLRHREVVGSGRYAETIETAADFYRRRLFTSDGAPNYDETSAYPRDIHAVAQGAITFCRLGEPGFARRILEWGLEHLYAGDGRFYYQKGRLFTRRITLMRWCQAWMAYAVATYLVTDRTGTDAARHVVSE